MPSPTGHVTSAVTIVTSGLTLTAVTNAAGQAESSVTSAATSKTDVINAQAATTVVDASRRAETEVV